MRKMIWKIGRIGGMVKIGVLAGLWGVAGACSGLPEGVKQSLELAGENKKELQQVLKHYSQQEEDSLKFRAACFLIDHMKWHTNKERITETDPQLEVFRQWMDTTYYQMVKGRTNEEILTPEFNRLLEEKRQVMSDSVAKYSFRTPTTEQGVFPDLENLNSAFLTGHIDNAFREWERSPFARHLTFDEFCEYLLPYCCMRLQIHTEPGNQLNEIFDKYVNNGAGGTIRDYIQRYNLAVLRGRGFLGNCPVDEPLGFYDLFFNGKHDCVDIANYGCNILRACGIPVVVEFNSAYRDLTSRHFHCALLDSAKTWQTFNPESSLPGGGDWAFAITLNVYRYYFSAQKDAPFFLKSKEEYLPGFMNNPCIRDVTAHLKEVVSVTLPFTPSTPNRLAHLATFQKNDDGLIPVTWGEIDTVKNQVTFKNSLFKMLYFPIYYEDTEIRTFGDPFYLVKDTTIAAGFRIAYVPNVADEKGELVLTRKFPRKSNMVRLAEELVGSRFTGANRGDFSDADTLFTIWQAPEPYLQDYKLRNRKAYRFYRFSAPEAHPHANVAMLEFLTEKSYEYENAMPPTPLPVLSPKAAARRYPDWNRVKLLDAPSWEEMKRKPEYDGNMQTAPGAYPNVTLRLKKPQVVTRIRFAPKNADNGIAPGDRFELMYWSNGWQSFDTLEAVYSYVAFQDAPLNRLYWLRNVDRGKEELPFIIKNGKQQFLYYDFVF